MVLPVQLLRQLQLLHLLLPVLLGPRLHLLLVALEVLVVPQGFHLPQAALEALQLLLVPSFQTV